MLAGVDLAGLRELAAICRDASWEAMVSLTVSGTLAPDGTAVIVTLPMLVGPARVVRPFSITFDVSRPAVPGAGSPPLPGSGAVNVPGAGFPAPVDGLLAAIGGDAVATAAISLALQGVDPTRISARAQLDASGGIACSLRISGDLAPEQPRTVAEHVRRFAVTHRTVAEPATVRLRATGAGPVSERGPGEGAGPGSDVPFPARSVDVEWEAGGYSVASAAGVSLPIDQPKQLFGRDRGPGPQEYLLAAVTAEALSFLARAGAQVHVSARLDLRGTLGIAGSPVGLRDILVQFPPPAQAAASAGPAGVPAELTAWARDGAVLRLVRQSREIPVSAEIAVSPGPGKGGEYAESLPAVLPPAPSASSAIPR